jgi:hypothetical protein
MWAISSPPEAWDDPSDRAEYESDSSPIEGSAEVVPPEFEKYVTRD